MNNNPNDCSMALIVRSDLNLSIGKTAVQCSHAAVECTRLARKSYSRIFERWRSNGSRKVVLKVDDLDHLKELQDIADKANIVTYIVRDAGLTEVEPGTLTVLGVGPCPNRSLDAICGELESL